MQILEAYGVNSEKVGSSSQTIGYQTLMKFTKLLHEKNITEE